MIFLFAFILIISSGSVFCTVFFKRRYEEIVSITIFSIIIILYFFGLFNALKMGVYFVVGGSIALYMLSFYRTIKKKEFKGLVKNTITPAFVLFMGFIILACRCNIGRVPCSWDEFSHWADTVKAMCTINDFGTNSIANTAFPSYPPAMSLFQYFVQVLNNIVKGSTGFSEWRLYLAYQVAIFSLFLPFMKRLNFRDPIKMLGMGTIIFIVPLIFFEETYNALYIDPFLGILFGFVLAKLFVDQEYDLVDSVTICLSIFILTITKDVGFMFAITSFVIFGINVMAFNYNKKGGTKFLKAKILACALLSLIIPKLTWNYNIKITESHKSFATKINLKELILLFLHKISNYKSEVLKKYSEVTDLSKKKRNHFIGVPLR